jgi:hypothetical protein
MREFYLYVKEVADTEMQSGDAKRKCVRPRMGAAQSCSEDVSRLQEFSVAWRR